MFFFRLDVREIAIVYKPPQSPRYSPPTTYPAPSFFFSLPLLVFLRGSTPSLCPWQSVIFFQVFVSLFASCFSLAYTCFFFFDFSHALRYPPTIHNAHFALGRSSLLQLMLDPFLDYLNLGLWKRESREKNNRARYWRSVVVWLEWRDSLVDLQLGLIGWCVFESSKIEKMHFSQFLR